MRSGILARENECAFSVSIEARQAEQIDLLQLSNNLFFR